MLRLAGDSSGVNVLIIMLPFVFIFEFFHVNGWGDGELRGFFVCLVIKSHCFVVVSDLFDAERFAVGAFDNERFGSGVILFQGQLREPLAQRLR